MIMNFFFNILKGYWSRLIALATHGNLNKSFDEGILIGNLVPFVQTSNV